jgi:glycine/D-amino acid oxidase-like deaminating enzyme
MMTAGANRVMPRSVATNEGTRHTSVWIDTGPEPAALPRLEHSVEADVAVLGGGIVGITTALLLQEAGVRVVLLEADRLARGVSGYTTAKVSSQHGMIYARLRSSFGADGGRTYGAANEAALAWMADRVEQDGIDCDLRRRASYVYLGADADPSDAQREAEAAIEAGLPAALVEETPLPYPVAAAVRFDEQAEFHPRSYLLALAEQLDEVYEHSRAVQVDTGPRCVVKTPGGNVTADHVVVATHYPFLDRALAALPHRGRAAGGHVHQRRLADALDPGRADRRRRAAARRGRGPQDR